ncbi:TonB-dependent receptor [Granulicella tundricola]|uniref:Cna B domain protein n=1 Tax=Granulicella tundricola (strain ATCC BAA-1859 / DSM 23138 / MP5ACTX9) TaxID=1198114 RepID=E8X5Y0_GRATM|nr:TonB-dependent receptor [Granulicella tundricola]ADW70864.1 Cna B domain protein [Granulicella tundricola MP5ACTX9]
MIRIKRHQLCALGTLAFAAAASGQNTTQGAISGTVFDPSEAAIPNATVRIHNDGTNADLTLTTNDSGFFKAPALAPGTYTVTVEATGFGTLRTNQVTVEVNLVTEVSPHLQTGSAGGQTVEVTADAPVLKFDSPAYGGQLTNAEIENIPINNRRWSSLSLLTPGVTNDAQGFGLISFRAIQPQLNNVQIDGADDNQVFYGEERGRTRAGYSTSQVAIREFQINTGVYSAEFGRAVGGVINSVTKSGTNQFHGELYFYHRDQQWSASNQFTTTIAYDPVAGTASKIFFKPKDKRNQWGFGLGGPIIKDKLFFFYAYDQFQRVFPGTGSAASASFYTALTPAQSATLATSIQNGTGKPTTAAQASTAYNNLIAAANTDLGTTPRIGFQIINTPKLDYTINSKNTVSLLYHRLRWDSPGGVQTQSNVFYGKEGFAKDFVKLDYTVAKLDSVITPRITNEIRYQYGRELNDESALPNGSFVNQYMTANGNTPQVNLNNGSQGFIAGQPYYAFRPALPDERKWQIGDTALAQFGPHAVKFGTDIVHNYDLQNTLGFSGFSPNGTYNYTSVLAFAQDALSGDGGGCGTTPAAGVAYAPVGCYSYFHQTVGGTTFDMSTVDYGFFVQDDWKVSPRLTVNVGARYDYESIPGQQANLVVASFAPSANTISDKNNISPRVGFAYDPFGLGKTVIRGGFGMYYGRIPNVNILGARFASGAAAGQLSYNIPAPTAAGAPLLPTLPANFTGQTPDIQYIDKHLQNPYTEQFDLAVQQNLGWDTIFSLSYLGALGRELPNSLNLNVDPANAYTVNYTVLAGTTGTCGPLACGSVVPVKVYGQRRAGSSASVNLNPAYGAVYAGLSNVNANYHAATVGMTKRANKFMSFDVNYTWSHALDYNQTSVTGFSSNNFFDPYGNARANYGNSYLNVRHRAVGWAIFNLPGTKGHHYVDAATNGWSIKPALQVQSGLPYSASVNTANAPAQCTANGCLQATNGGLSGLGVTYVPAIGRNTYTYPRDLVIDVRIQKDFKLTERFNLQFIGEAFNVANYQNVTSLVTTAYNVTSTTNATTGSGTLTYQPHTATGGFGYVNSVNSNFAYSPRNIQAGARLFF